MRDDGATLTASVLRGWGSGAFSSADVGGSEGWGDGVVVRSAVRTAVVTRVGGVWGGGVFGGGVERGRWGG